MGFDLSNNDLVDIAEEAPCPSINLFMSPYLK
jgi:hypothetical protein